MEQDDHSAVLHLLNQRWATLACTNADGSALASQVAIAWIPGTNRLLMHLSTLAKHTRNLMARAQACISVSELDDGRADPQTLARISLEGTVTAVGRDEPGHADLAAHYLTRLPEAAPRFDFGDFNVFQMEVKSAQFVGGFARAFKISADELAQISRERPSKS